MGKREGETLSSLGPGTQSCDLNFSYLLLVHLVCADEQVHIEESKRLFEIGGGISLNDETRNEAEKILNQKKDALGIEAVAKHVPVERRDALLNLLLTLTYTDGFCDPLERAFLQRVAKCWNVKCETLDAKLVKAEKEHGDSVPEAGADEPEEISTYAHILKNVEAIIPEPIVRIFQQIAPASISQTIHELHNEILLAGPEYDVAIAKSNAVANADIVTTEKVLDASQACLKKLMLSFSIALKKVGETAKEGTATSAKEVMGRLSEDCEKLEREVLRHVQQVCESLHRKKRASRFFTISFLGKTKTGKSTLHAIVTGEGWEAIGAGGQRTTRLNRVYQWKHIRIIDTPGIGAPGGKTDEEIAKSVIDESDIICFVVTNNNQQETEFQLLRLLKQRAKPLLILLNVQENLTTTARLDRFLKAPDRLFSVEDKRCLGGHYDRIQNYAKKFYGNAYFDIIPVQLLAAQMARNGSQPEKAEALYRGSRLQHFLDTLRMGLVDYGDIRRSQTLLGSTAADILTPANWVKLTADRYHEIADKLSTQKAFALKRMKTAGQDSVGRIERAVNEVFNELEASVATFAEDHWDLNEDELGSSWEEHIKSLRINQRLKSAVETVTGQYQKDVADILEELGRELCLVSELQLGEKGLASQDTSSLAHDIFNWGGILASGAGSIALIVLGISNPVGWVLAGIGLGFKLLASLFESKAEKRRKAAEEISSSLLKSIKKQRKDTVSNLTKEFQKQDVAVRERVESYFCALVYGLSQIRESLNKAWQELQRQANEINLAYASRILEWVESNGAVASKARNAVIDVKRDIGKTIQIGVCRPVTQHKGAEMTRRVLQEDVVFRIKSSANRTLKRKG